MLFVIIVIVSIALLVGADQVIKYIVDTSMTLGETKTAIDGVLNWTYVQNDGAAFGILRNQRWFFLIGTAIVIAVLLWMLFSGKIRGFIGRASAVLIVAGGIGNMIDRALYGYVIDYIDISPLFQFAVFNFADCCVTVGGIALVVYILFIHDRLAPQKPEAVEDGADS